VPGIQPESASVSLRLLSQRIDTVRVVRFTWQGQFPLSGFKACGIGQSIKGFIWALTPHD
jgi:hypothetical protein